MNLRLASMFSLLFCINCRQEQGECRNNFYENQFDYKINADKITDGGIEVDDSGQDIDLSLIDKLTEEVEQCLLEQFGEKLKIPKDVSLTGQCMFDSFNLPAPRSCFKVKIPSEWTLSCDGSQQVLLTTAPQYLCNQKGLAPNQDCPCRWRAGIQEGNNIVTTPSFYLYKDPLIRIITGCNNPWGHEKLAVCAAPSVPKLPEN